MIYYIIPKLIIQPTWGGDYIPNIKGLDLKDQKIGQSYEFFSGSKVVDINEVSKLKPKDYPFMIGSNEEGDEKLKNKIKGIVDIAKIEMRDTFGKRRIPELLIKLTQAKGNSFQLHSKLKTGKYLPKPESWYFFKEGLATLGIDSEMNLEEYKEVCKDIYKHTKKLSKEVKNGNIKIEDARADLREFIELNSPMSFVNEVKVPFEGIVENISGGIHHSWEEDPDEMPDGNILYEVQKDVPDSKSTIRSFDKGKLLDNGDYRKLDIDSYFEYLDKLPANNAPEKLLKPKLKLKDLKDWTLNKIFHNNYYQMDELILKGSYNVEGIGFRHIYVRQGEAIIKTKDGKFNLNAGHSYIIPATTDKITIKSKSKDEDKKFLALLTYEKIKK